MNNNSLLKLVMLVGLPVVALWSLLPSMRGQGQVVAPAPAPAVVVANPPMVQHRVLDMGQIPVAKGQTPASTLESVLNDFAADGWKVVTAAGALVIMER